MEQEKPEKKEVAKILVIDQHSFQIPQCCREGWEDCPHTIKREKPKKSNIGM